MSFALNPKRNVAATLTFALYSFLAIAQNPQQDLWTASGQFTYIWHQKDAFPARYTNLNGSPNSLLPTRERSYTLTATAFLGLMPWQGGELFAVPELISMSPLSGLHGLGGSIQNGELEKNGSKRPTVYSSRLFFRQTWGFGGDSTALESGPMQLARSADSRRLVVTAGNLAVIDIFDKNSFAGDVRQQFINMDFLTYAAYDFAADARGYSWGLAGEYYYDDWAFRAARFIGPRDPNQLQLNYSIMKFHGDTIELEHKHKVYGQSGKVRALYYRNVFNQGRFADAVAAFQADPTKNATTCTGFNYQSDNAGAPDLCWSRQRNTKTGIGLSLEQSIGDGAGAFLRGMKSDGRSEVYSYTATDSSVSAGTIVKGAPWGRAQDAIGIGYAQNWISASHVNYLNLGGIDGFIGDGKITYKPEKAFEVYYNANLTRFFWLTLDFQRIANPGYNADRGPVRIYGFRLHSDF